MVRGQIYLTMSCCLPCPETCRLATTLFRGYSVHLSILARMFAVYASSPLLPPETQDSLHSGAGFTFYDGTFTRKMQLLAALRIRVQIDAVMNRQEKKTG